MSGMNTGLEGTRRKYDTAVFDRIKLDNGVTIWRQKPTILTDQEGVVAVYLLQVGSIADGDQPGIAHFLEHMLFRGTKKYPSTTDIMKAVNEQGCVVNAVTSSGWTRFQILGLPGREKFAIDTLFDLVMHPLLREEDVMAERRVIAAEHTRHYSTDNARSTERLLSVACANTPMSRVAIGDIDVIQKMDPASLRKFHRRNYRAGNIHVVLGGTFANKKVVGLVKRTFGSLRSTPSSLKRRYDSELMRAAGRHHKFVLDGLSQNYYCILYPIKVTEEVDGQALQFLTSAIRDISSPLMVRLREKRNIVYEVTVGADEITRGVWHFSITVPTSFGDFSVIMSEWLASLNDLTADRLWQLFRADQLQRLRSYTDAVNVCLRIGNELSVYGNIRPYHWEEELRDQITIEKLFFWINYFRTRQPLVVEVKKGK